ncbi:helix-turn-helix transcriptional regulator, partial [candidate division KSB1 bacterium]|nr:helix-turn-helix transcriptional regulator [candidate division KSB1 bacterium]
MTAKELFFKYGIRRVTIEEICKKARVSKMTFYKFFQNKIELAIVMLKKLYDDAEEDLDKITNSD